MSTEAIYLLVNTTLLSLITILLEGIVVGSERYRLAYCSPAAGGQRNQSIGRLESPPQRIRPTSRCFQFFRSFQPSQCFQPSQSSRTPQCSQPTQCSQTTTQTTQPIQFSPSQASNRTPKAVRSTEFAIVAEEQQRNSRGSQLSRLTGERLNDKSRADNAEQFYLLQIPSTIHTLAYISLIFISLFLIFRFRSLIKLCTVAYALVLMTVSFLFLRRSLFRIYTSNLFGSTALSDGSSCEHEGGRPASRLERLGRLEGARNSGSFSACSTGGCVPLGNGIKLTNSKKCSMPSKFKNTFITGLIYGLNLSISALLAYIWFVNQRNGCFWLYHNALGILVCLFCVSALRLINFRQIFITFTLLTVADLVCVYAFKLHGISVLNEIVKEQKLDKRDLNDVEELNVGQNTINRVNLTDSTAVGPYADESSQGEPALDEAAVDKTILDETSLDETGSGGLDRHISQITDQNKLYRIPCVFLIPKSHSLRRCVDLKNTAKLGFGDLIIAGIIASFCFCFDKTKSTSLVYFLASLISSLTGLALMLFVDDLLQANGQPVLLFIVPINFVVLLSLAYRREESEAFWLNTLANDRSLPDTVNQQPEEVPFEVF